MSKVNTLFAYFSKTPKKTEDNQVLSPNNNTKSKTNGTPAGKQHSKNGDITQEFSVGDVVWSKLEGYPWWPSLVCNHPTTHTHLKKGKVPEVHVQFFDDPVSRAWVKAKFVRSFTGADSKDARTGGTYFSMDPAQRKGVTSADKAMKMSKEERLGLVVELQPSEDEDEMKDLENMFEESMSEEDDSDKSKENVNIEKSPKESKSKESPKKTPKKGTRRSERSKPKRRRIIVESDSDSGESADEYKVPRKSGSEEEEDDDDDDSFSSGVNEEEISEPEPESASEPEPSPVKKNARKRKLGESTPVTASKRKSIGSSSTPKNSSFVASLGSATKSKLSLFSAPESNSSGGAGDASEGSTTYLHQTLDFLKPEKIKDIKGRSPDHPEYDQRTLYIPESFKSKVTPAMRQWWDLKSKHYDTILFFKVGKFYELFHMDAFIGVKELGLIYMKGDYAHSGFPEIAYGRYADTLVQKGYKVARVEQTETPEIMNERVKKMTHAPTKFDKVMKREICRITTKGTKTYSYMEGDCCDVSNSYLLSIAEKEEESDGCFSYGVCFVDTSIGKFNIGQFKDDRHCSRLRTLLAHFSPVQVLYERGKTSTKLMQMINNLPGSVIKEGLTSVSEFWESTKALKVLAEGDYFRDESEQLLWPPVLKKMIGDAEAVNVSAADGYVLAITALGAILWYLKHSLVDEELLSMKNFQEYIPSDRAASASLSEDEISEEFAHKKHMVLDGVTLTNLDVIENANTGTSEGTLLGHLDQCSTPFGKRLFRNWLCSPLCNPKSINDRLDALEDLMAIADVSAEVREQLKKLPDLERILSRMHSLGSSTRNQNHPDSRAILYEDVVYSKRKIEDLLSGLNGFKQAMKIIQKFEEKTGNLKSKILTRTVTVKDSENFGYFPDLAEKLKYFDNGFDHDKAKKDGVIVPNKGMDPEYDEAVQDIKSTTRELDSYLERQRQRLGCRSIVYWGTGKNRYQIEVPESVCKRVPDDYEVMSSKKGWKRYRTKEIEQLLAKITDAEDRKSAALKDTMRRVFHKFDTDYKLWDQATQCLAVLDVLLCMAEYSRCGDGSICRPEFLMPKAGEKPYLEIREGRHACITHTSAGDDFIPNDTLIGIKDDSDMETDDSCSDGSIVLVTGPNMGGKSTLMRQVGLIVIMAQMGCYVPAEKCHLTPVDRVFTRLGASDRIMAGESTFFVELSETASILQHASQHSLVLLDELGRGTATYDGTAIAAAVVKELSENIKCRTLFSTHYHSLTDTFANDPNIRLGHMSCMVENENEDPTQETITFLYKFVKGACPKSYGFNAARLANIPDEIIRCGVKKAKEMENCAQRLLAMRSLWNIDTYDNPERFQELLSLV